MKNVTLCLFAILMILCLHSCKKTEAIPESWHLQSSGIIRDLHSVFFTDAKTGFAVGDSGLILKTINGGSTWKLVESPTNAWFTSVYFPKDNIGYIAGHNGMVLKTDNSGNTWSVLLYVASLDLNGVFFVNADIGFAAGFKANGSDEDFSVEGIIIKTTDGGKNWETIYTGVGSALYSVCFADASTGYSAGQNGTILKTTDGGLTWDILNSGSINNFQTVTFIDKNIGFVGGGTSYDNVGEILKTEDGGESWVSILTDTRSVTSFSFNNPDQGYATSYNNNLEGVILKTENGGSSWTEQSTGIIFPCLNSVCSASVNSVIAVGAEGAILKWGQ